MRATVCWEQFVDLVDRSSREFCWGEISRLLSVFAMGFGSHVALDAVRGHYAGRRLMLILLKLGSWLWLSISCCCSWRLLLLWSVTWSWLCWSGCYPWLLTYYTKVGAIVLIIGCHDGQARLLSVWREDFFVFAAVQPTASTQTSTSEGNRRASTVNESNYNKRTLRIT